MKKLICNRLIAFVFISLILITTAYPVFAANEIVPIVESDNGRLYT